MCDKVFLIYLKLNVQVVQELEDVEQQAAYDYLRV